MERMSATRSNSHEADERESREACYRAVAKMFRTDERVWLVDEQYETQATTWRLTIVRRAEQERWMRQRYHYDVPTGVIYFMGQRPVTDEELAAVRRSGKLFPTPSRRSP
jgi:hypothetical protein